LLAIIIIQNSWKFSLQSKFKRERQAICEEENVVAIRKKYSNPGKTGRKRKCPEVAAAQDIIAVPGLSQEIPISKTFRFKVQEFLSAFICFQLF